MLLEAVTNLNPNALLVAIREESAPIERSSELKDLACLRQAAESYVQQLSKPFDHFESIATPGAALENCYYILLAQLWQQNTKNLRQVLPDSDA